MARNTLKVVEVDEVVQFGEEENAQNGATKSKT
jgi:hypothetical protein